MDKIKANIIKEIDNSLSSIRFDNEDLKWKFQRLQPEDLNDAYIKNNNIDSYLFAMESEVQKIYKLIKLLK